ncbi:UvrD-helicase domain-containing protein [Chromobacterium phragmitis]|uniref:UvrD-helicase domain-containing protein n=1 Tax=Chromobacterium amazonense TaxID=1382803 RepID=UPI0021B79CFC|nr:UvrD-helicase domain-containing protein [Chromobacterium amazonense]MBM2882829.1 UvrD-helicase domain-containing protein [Chromobacterium amazonense]
MNTTFSPGFFGRLFTNTPLWALSFSSPTPSLTYAGHTTSLTTETIASGRVVEGLIWADLTIGKKILSGLTNDRAHELLKEAKRLHDDAVARTLHAEKEALRKAEEEHLKTEFRRLIEPISRLNAALNTLLKGPWYIRKALILNFLAEWKSELNLLRELETLLAHPFFDHDTYADARQLLLEIFYHVTPPYIGFKKRNEAFVITEKEQWSEYFKTVEKTELTDEQQIGAIVHEDCNRIIAAAGSGKSSTLVAKVGYAIKKDYVKPHEVLALAFNNDAAKELSQRLTQRLGLPIKAQTFHSLGKEILLKTTGPKGLLRHPAIPLKNQLEQLLQKDAHYRTNFYLHYAIHHKAEPVHEFSSIAEYEAYIRQVGKRDPNIKERWGIPSLRGEHVRSFEELAIANWLYVHGVEYRYEILYPHDIEETGWNKYEPDFSYTRPDGSTLYHEHFALREDESSPFGASYIQGAKEKRRLHAKHKTALIETWSAGFRNGRVFIELEDQLKAHGVAFSPMSTGEIEAVLKVAPHGDFLRLTGALIAHAKEAGYDEQALRTRANSVRDQVRAQSFLTLFFPIWERYQAYLKQSNQIDFADMIGTAAAQVAQGAYESPYKLILVDEFQDISRGRSKLVQAMLAQHQDSVLFGVGDDWQAINRFAGSDLSIMRNFEEEFGKTETNYLRKTFRSNQGISTVAAKFVSENTAQLPKDVEAVRRETEGVVRIAEFSDLADQQHKIKAKLEALAAKALNENRTITVMLLGRYKYKTTDAMPEALVEEWCAHYAGRLTIMRKEKEKNGKKVLEALDTVHSSKGLEADYVLVHSLQAQYYGFPCEIEDDPLLALVLAEHEAFVYAEDRRLFYVALTRAKEEVTLYTLMKQPSPFVLELLGKEYRNMVKFDEKTEKPEPCPQCRQGYLMLKESKYRPFIGCSAFRTNGCEEKRQIARERIR